MDATGFNGHSPVSGARVLRYGFQMNEELPSVVESERRPSPVVTPQALASDGTHFWLSSRDLGTLHRIDREGWTPLEELDPPGVVWAAVKTNDSWRFTIGKGLNDDRYVYSYAADEGFRKLFACPEFAGSYLSFDGKHLYLSQWYKGRILKLSPDGECLRVIEVGEEICGHTFVDDQLYVLHGREDGEAWRIAVVDPREETPQVKDLAALTFAARSLAYDGRQFLSNHRAGNETVVFTLPAV